MTPNSASDRSDTLGNPPRPPRRRFPLGTALAVLLPVAGVLALATFALISAAQHSEKPAASPAAAKAAAADLDVYPPPPLMRPFTHPPLPEPLVLTGTFGEQRNSHIHAGLDFSTGGSVGMPVYACENGTVVRVRAQGVGYGRSVYLQTDAGLLLVYGHLDAFDDPVASYVGAIQDSSGQYEQDLWPSPGQMRIAAGARLGWSGRSGTGSPHLHFEVRRGDMALNPLRNGIVVADSTTPQILAITLEPLDERSRVNGVAGPFTFDPAAMRDTLAISGRVRCIVRTADAGERRSTMAPWSVGIEWKGERTAFRADSVSWALDGGEVDYVYDLGRAAPFSKQTNQIWAAAGVRPRTMVTNRPSNADAGAINCDAREPAQPLRVFARDVVGHEGVQVVWVRGAAVEAPAAGPMLTRTPARRARAADAFRFSALPGGALGVRVSGAGTERANMLGMRVDTAFAGPAAPLSRRGVTGYTIVSPPPAGRALELVAQAAVDGGAVQYASDTYRVFRPGAAPIAEGTVRVTLDASQAFESNTLLFAAGDAPSATSQLIPLGMSIELLPARYPLRTGARIELGASPGRWSRTGLYMDRGEGEGWELVSMVTDSVRRVVIGESRRLGRFAVFADTVAPRFAASVPPHRWTRGAYPTWALSATISDGGSGIDARASHFIVDGARVPSEFDSVRGELRWRPRRAPASGPHSYTLVAVDRAGNVRRSGGRFVLD